MKKIFICMIICVVGTSCSQKDVMPSILNDFPEIIHLSDGIVLIDDYMFEPYGIQVSDSLLFAYSSSSGLDQVKITDLRTMRDISFLKKGRGPGEATHVNGIQVVNDSLFVNVEPRMIYLYSIEDIIAGQYQPNYVYHGISGEFVHNDFFLCEEKNLSDDKNSTMFQLNNISGTTEYFGDFIGSDIDYPEHDYTKQTAFQGKLYLAPSRSKAIFVYYYAIGYDIIDLETLEVSHHIWKAPQVDVKYVEQIGANFVFEKTDREVGFHEGAATYDCIYLLYITGDSSYVLEYDWSGSARKQYKITSKVDRFFIDNDGKCIYALCPINGKYSLICYNLE